MANENTPCGDGEWEITERWQGRRHSYTERRRTFQPTDGQLGAHVAVAPRFEQEFIGGDDNGNTVRTIVYTDGSFEEIQLCRDLPVSAEQDNFTPAIQPRDLPYSVKAGNPSYVTSWASQNRPKRQRSVDDILNSTRR